MASVRYNKAPKSARKRAGLAASPFSASLCSYQCVVMIKSCRTLLLVTSLFLCGFSSAREMPLEAKNLEFGYHNVFWSDFNNDGIEDLFILSGYEDYFSTYIYIGNSDNPELSKIYENNTIYSMVLDIENDKHPEFIESSDSNICRSSIFPPFVPASLLPLVTAEYEKVVGEYDKANFTFNMPEHFPLFNLQLLNKIRIYRIEEQQVVDVTSEYPEHINWRIHFLKKILKHNDDKCVMYLNGLIDYLESILNQKEHNKKPQPIGSAAG